MKPFRKSKRLSNSLSSSKHSISLVTTTQYSADELDKVLKSPKKVIKALYDYEAQGPGELRFNKGDFFHVLAEGSPEDVPGHGWYDATNPATNQRGMVPMSHFEVFNRTRPALNLENGHGIEQSNLINAKFQHAVPGGKAANQTLYGVTLYDFKAERPDELDIVPGENLVICAHHDYEWFIVKPITRLGGPGLVPVLYVKIIDVMLTSKNLYADEDTVAMINHFKIPTVEQWKDQTAKYQALTIPLGHVSNSAPVVSSNSQYFQADGQVSNRSLLSLTNTTILEASVDSYHLEHGRYQYLVTARLSNGKTRYLHRYYQDFYDLQVKLLELFPYEAGKIENSRRIIPSIPGPLINVNDSISKLRREKLDYYLRNLIALPLHISRCEDVLGLFEVTDNGFDKEVTDSKGERSSKPIKQQSNYQQDRISQYSNLQPRQRTSASPLLESPLQRTTSASSTNLLNQNQPIDKLAKVKVKFYYEDDIFVLLLPVNLRLQDLKTKLVRRLGLESEEGSEGVYLFLKNDYDEFMDANNVATDVLTPELRESLFSLEIDDDTKFHGLLFDKCKVVILSG